MFPMMLRKLPRLKDKAGEGFPEGRAMTGPHLPAHAHGSPEHSGPTLREDLWEAQAVSKGPGAAEAAGAHLAANRVGYVRPCSPGHV